MLTWSAAVIGAARNTAMAINVKRYPDVFENIFGFWFLRIERFKRSEFEGSWYSKISDERSTKRMMMMIKSLRPTYDEFISWELQVCQALSENWERLVFFYFFGNEEVKGFLWCRFYRRKIFSRSDVDMAWGTKNNNRLVELMQGNEERMGWWWWWDKCEWCYEWHSLDGLMILRSGNARHRSMNDDQTHDGRWSMLEWSWWSKGIDDGWGGEWMGSSLNHLVV